jgi:hypothetical protein
LSLDRTPQTNKNLLAAVNGYPSSFTNEAFSEREKRRMIEKMEDKYSFTSLDKYYRSAQVSPGR